MNRPWIDSAMIAIWNGCGIILGFLLAVFFQAFGGRNPQTFDGIVICTTGGSSILFVIYSRLKDSARIHRLIIAILLVVIAQSWISFALRQYATARTDLVADLVTLATPLSFGAAEIVATVVSFVLTSRLPQQETAREESSAPEPGQNS